MIERDQTKFQYAEAVRDHRAGRIDEAWVKYREILSVEPHHADALHMLGVIAAGRGHHHDAFVFFEKAVACAPRNASFLNNLGVSARAIGDTAYAEKVFQEALAIDPELLDAHCNLGNSLFDRNDISGAKAHYVSALKSQPSHRTAQLGLAQIFRRRGDLKRATEIYQSLVSAFPSDITVRNNLGVVRMESGALSEALEHYSVSLNIDPNNQETLNNMAVAFLADGNTAVAEATLRRLITLNPESPEAYGNLGNVLRRQGRYEDAASSYRAALQVRPDPGVRIRLATLLPVIPSSIHAMAEAREKTESAIDALLAEKIHIDDPINEVGITNFHLSYHDEDNRVLNGKIARLYAKACPTLEFVAPHCKKPERRTNRKIKVGFVSRYLRNHAVGWCYHRILRHLSREKIHVSAFTFLDDNDPVWRAIAEDVDNAVILPNGLIQARERLAREKLDVLVYTDIGMEPLTYFLAFSRLAPVQCVTNGHPDTTGIPAIDYFISSAPLEQPDASAYYSEELAALDGVLVDYDRPVRPYPLKLRDAFGLPENATLYVCPQSLFKIHPDMDSAFAEILKRDPKASIIVFEGPEPHWSDLLKQRWAKQFGENIERVQILKRQSLTNFLNILCVTDVLLDTWPFSGGNTAYQGLAMGVPIVTFPSRFARGRSTMALYERLEISELIAATSESYIDIALRLGTNRAWRSKLGKRIQDRCDRLFEDHAAADSFAQFLLRAGPRSADAS